MGQNTQKKSKLNKADEPSGQVASQTQVHSSRLEVKCKLEGYCGYKA
jgi:hypothetical protein